MKRERFLRIIQDRAARLAVGPSTTRGRGSRGAIAAARLHLGRLSVTAFSVRDQTRFTRRLSSATRVLMHALPPKARSWGLARKVLNIFLRDCLYNVYLRKAHGLAAIEQMLEIPLDSITARAIREEMPELPRWPGVRNLTPDLSAAYQAAAMAVAKREGIARVHLDAYWWGGARE